MKKKSWLKRTMISPVFLNYEEQKFEPPDKPVREYERILFLAMLNLSCIAKLLSFVTKWRGLHFVALGLIIIVVVVSLFHLLVPPHISNTRLTYLGCSLLIGWAFLLPDVL